jgi:hypothetical protein
VPDFRAWFPSRLRFFLQQLNAHHQVEDLHYFPVFQAAEARLARGFDVLEGDHHTIHQSIDRAVETANAFLRTAVNDRGPLLAAADTYAAASDALLRQLRRHLGDEEDLIIPLILDRSEAGPRYRLTLRRPLCWPRLFHKPHAAPLRRRCIKNALRDSHRLSHDCCGVVIRFAFRCVSSALSRSRQHSLSNHISERWTRRPGVRPAGHAALAEYDTGAFAPRHRGRHDVIPEWNEASGRRGWIRSPPLVQKLPPRPSLCFALWAGTWTSTRSSVRRTTASSPTRTTSSNHSCDPNLRYGTDAMSLRARHPAKRGSLHRLGFFVVNSTSRSPAPAAHGIAAAASAARTGRSSPPPTA